MKTTPFFPLRRFVRIFLKFFPRSKKFEIFFASPGFFQNFFLKNYFFLKLFLKSFQNFKIYFALRVCPIGFSDTLSSNTLFFHWSLQTIFRNFFKFFLDCEFFFEILFPIRKNFSFFSLMGKFSHNFFRFRFFSKKNFRYAYPFNGSLKSISTVTPRENGAMISGIPDNDRS